MKKPITLDANFARDYEMCLAGCGEFIPSGYKEIDKCVPIREGEVSIIAGRQGMGKTSLALNITLNASSHNGAYPILYVSNLQSEESLINQLVCMDNDIDQRNVYSKNLRPTEILDMKDSANYIMDSTLHFLFDPEIRLKQLYSFLYGEYSDVKLVLIDEVENMAQANHMSLKQFIAAVRVFAEETNTAVIGILDIPSEIVDHRVSHFPEFYLGDFNDCCYADNCIAILRRNFYDKNCPEEEMAFLVKRKGDTEQTFFLKCKPRNHRVLDTRLDDAEELLEREFDGSDDFWQYLMEEEEAHMEELEKMEGH